MEQIREYHHRDHGRSRPEHRSREGQDHEEFASEEGDAESQRDERRRGVGDHAGQDARRLRQSQTRKHEGLPGRLERAQAELDSRSQRIGLVVDADDGEGLEAHEDEAVGEVQGLDHQAMGCLGQAEGKHLPQEPWGEGGPRVAQEHRQQAEGEGGRGEDVAPEHPGHPEAGDDEGNLQRGVQEVASDVDGGEGARPSLDAEEVQGNEGERARVDVGGGEQERHPRVRGLQAEYLQEQRRAHDDQQQQRRAHGSGEQGDRSGQARPLLVGFEVVVDAEEPRVEAEAEDDLRHRAEREQDDDHADFGRSEDPDVERREGQVDDLGRRVLGAVDGGVREERLEVRGKRNARSRNGSGGHCAE